MNFFQNLLSSIMSRSRQGGYFRSKDFGILHEDINKALESVMSKSGEVSSLVYAEHLSHLIEGLDDIGLTLQKKEKITQYEATLKSSHPWII